MFFKTVYDLVKQIPRGSVATYGQIAKLAGNGRMSRQVGWALHQNPEPGVIPCHRVVNRMGELSPVFAFGGINEQARLLEAEGVELVAERVPLEKYQCASLSICAALDIGQEKPSSPPCRDKSI